MINITGIILDLRNDPGGLLSKSVDVSDMFLSEGIIVSIKGKDPNSNAIFVGRRANSPKSVRIFAYVERTNPTTQRRSFGAATRTTAATVRTLMRGGRIFSLGRTL